MTTRTYPPEQIEAMRLWLSWKVPVEVAHEWGEESVIAHINVRYPGGIDQWSEDNALP